MPFFSHISGDDRDGPTSRKSYDDRLAGGGSKDDEPAAADVAGRGMRHGQRKRGGHGGIDRVAAVLDDLESDL